MVYFTMKIIQQPALVKKIVIPQEENMYSSFPTFTEHNKKIFVFYRQGIKSESQCHGINGKIKCFEIDKELFLGAFSNKSPENMYASGNDYVIFEKGNEFDAIVSKLDKDTFSFATRTYSNKQMETFISFSDKPVFKERQEVKIAGVEWLVFYGKGFKCKEGYVFPAYGELRGEGFERPFVLITSNFSRFDVLSCLPSNINGSILNESSIIYDGRNYGIFLREDTPPFGIWYSASTDLQNWLPPEKLFSAAHAPMSLSLRGKIFLIYRDLLPGDNTGITLLDQLSGYKTSIDSYEGNPYDGGYADLMEVDRNLFAVYYLGNTEGEPYIKCCKL